MRNIHPTSRIVSCHLSNSPPQCSITPLIPCHSTLLVLIYWLLYVVCILYSLYSTVVTSGSLKCAVEINFGLTKYPNSNHGCAWKLQSKGLYTTSVSEFENVYIKRIHPPKSTLWFKKKKKSVHEATVLFFFLFSFFSNKRKKKRRFVRLWGAGSSKDDSLVWSVCAPVGRVGRNRFS